MTDDAGIVQQALHIRISETGDPVEIEPMERSTEVLAFREDGSPA